MEAQTMTQYAVIIYERETPGGVDDIPPEVLEAHGRLPERIKASGGRTVAGLALQPTATATSIRADLVTDGPFVETQGGDRRHLRDRGARPRPRASSSRGMTPIVDGGVEVRPLLGFAGRWRD